MSGVPEACQIADLLSHKLWETSTWKCGMLLIKFGIDVG
jgi:hypothetical protein